MAAKFFSDLSSEERDEWRQSHVTQLAVTMLREHWQQEQGDVLRATGLKPPNELYYDLGFQAGVQSAIDLLENEE